MGMFNIREPRRFEHKYIYYDERKERLAKIEEKAKEAGMEPKAFVDMTAAEIKRIWDLMKIVAIVLLTLLLLQFMGVEIF